VRINKLIKLSVLSRNLERIAADAPPSSAIPPPSQPSPKLLSKLQAAFHLLFNQQAGGVTAIENIIRTQPELKETWERIKKMSIVINEPTVRKDVEKANALAVQFWKNINDIKTISEKDPEVRKDKVKDGLAALKGCIDKMLILSDASGTDNNATLSAMIGPQTRKALQAIGSAMNSSNNPEEARNSVLGVMNNPECKSALGDIVVGVNFDTLNFTSITGHSPEKGTKETDTTSLHTHRVAPGVNYRYRFKGKAGEALKNIDKWFNKNANLIASSIRAGLTDKLVQSGLAAKIGESQVDIVMKEIKKLIE